MERKPSSKGMLLDIFSMRSRAIKLMEKENNYSSLLKVLTETDDYYDDDIPLPTIKELSERTGITYHKVRKQIEDIFTDLSDSFSKDSQPFLFPKKEIIFHLRTWHGSKMMLAEHLDYIPRVGEEVFVPFFRESLGSEKFYVSQISHKLTDEVQRIYITLNSGWYNLYWHIRKDQALENHEISFSDYLYKKTDTEIKDELRIDYNNPW
jgi:hypothetical protein